MYSKELLAGHITSGNSVEITKLKNPYNPVSLLMMGRVEAFVGWQAFMDSFWVGHGAWTQDKTGKYILLMQKLNDMRHFSDDERIPSHSVVVTAGVQNGIFAFLFMCSILLFFINKGIKAISKKNIYMVAGVYSIIDLMWNSLFSPPSYFRYMAPLWFAILLVNYIKGQGVNDPTDKVLK
jgi:O-antigen ligase